MAERIVTGHKQVDRALKRLERKSANRAARAGLNKGVRLGAKLTKAKVPSKLKTVRAAIGHSVKKDKRGITQAKFGAAVGKSRRKKPPKRSTSGGVGIGRANLHWWIQGTTTRRHKSGRNTGKMPENQIIRQTVRSGKTQIMNAIIEGATKAINRELEKLRRK